MIPRILLVLPLLVLACGGDYAPGPLPAGDAAPDAPASDAPAWAACYEPTDPLRAFSCAGDVGPDGGAVAVDCSACPTSCDVEGFEAGAGECRPAP